MSNTTPPDDRRKDDDPSTTIGYPQDLPALVLLDRLLTPVLAVDLVGDVTYANPAFARMLGHTGTAAVEGHPVSTLLVGRSDSPARDCVMALRTARGSLVDWHHAEEFAVHTRVSESMLLRFTDPLLLISVSDVTEWLVHRRAVRTPVAVRPHAP